MESELEPPVLTGRKEEDRKTCALLYKSSPHNSTLSLINRSWRDKYNYEIGAKSLRDWLNHIKAGKTLDFSSRGGRPPKVATSVVLETEQKLHVEAKHVSFGFILCVSACSAPS